jgi:hypothetical protein
VWHMKGLFSRFGRRTSQPDDAPTCAPTIEGMVAQLGSKDGVTRERARRALVEMGPRSVELLLQALRQRKSRVRFEAAMCLRDIGDRRAIDGLVEALGDRVFEVRWVAAEGLIVLGRPSVPAVLRALMERSDSIWLCEGCHHVLSHFAGLDLHSTYHLEHHSAWVDFDLRDVLKPVVQALDCSGSSSGAPVAAARAMEHFPVVLSPHQEQHFAPH